jgi:hypothetical protein
VNRLQTGGDDDDDGWTTDQVLAIAHVAFDEYQGDNTNFRLILPEPESHIWSLTQFMFNKV